MADDETPKDEEMQASAGSDDIERAQDDASDNDTKRETGDVPDPNDVDTDLSLNVPDEPHIGITDSPVIGQEAAKIADDFPDTAEPAVKVEAEKRKVGDASTRAMLDSEGDEFADLKRQSDQDNKLSSKARMEKAKADLMGFNYKKFTKPAIALAVIVVAGYAYFTMNQPRTGSMAYGICRIFLERYIQFPHSLEIVSVQEFSDSVRIWYVDTDSFGGRRIEPLQCFYKPDQRQGYILDKITLRRKELEQGLIDRFNVTLPVIRASEPDLTIPKPPPDRLRQMGL